PSTSWNDPPGRFYGNFGQFRKLRANGHKFNLGLSIGGWTWSKHFSSAVLTHEARAAFVATVLRIFDTYPGVFNRVDLDWEHISPPGKNYGEAGNEVRAEDPANFAAFLRLLRETLDATGRHHFEISACVVADPEKMVALPIQAMVQYLTTLNVMTYDFASSAWGPTPTAHNSNLRSTPYARLSVTLAVDHLLSLGVPANKIVIGAVLYSRGFANTDGIGHPSHGRVPGGSGNDDGGVLMYSELPPAGAAELYDAAAGAGYAYDAVRRVLWSYDTVESAREKCRFVWERGLRGVIVWESSGDVRDWNSPRSVLRALSDGLREPPAP
ncbi:glycoside hydrolase, partial [Zopfochytrium polystomum]